MAITLTDNRTIINEGDAITNWTGSPILFTSDPDPVEATGCIGYVVSATTIDAFVTVASTNLSSKLVYVWVFPLGAMDTQTLGGVSIHLGDGTNRVAYHLAGSDLAGFRHDSGPVGWQCLVMDTGNLPGTITTRAGVAGSLNFAAITQIGATFKTLVKSKGGVANCFIDVVRTGDPSLNSGAMLTVTGGTSGDTGKFSEIASADRTVTNQTARGILRQLGAGAYGCQGALKFGDNSGTTATFFADTDVTFIFENRGLGTTRYSLIIVGNATGSTTFRLGTKSGTGDTATGTNGCSLVTPTGVGSSFDASSANLQFLLIYGSTFSGFTNGITLSSNATNGPNHEFLGNTVASSGVFDPGRVVVRNCRFAGWTGATTSAALLWGANANVKRCTFTSAGTGHAIKFTATGTYTFDGIEFSGYGADATNDASIYNDSGGLVTLNVTGASTGLTVRNGTGASTVINNAVSLTVTVVDSTGAAIQNARVAIYQTSNNTELLNALTDVSGVASTSFAYVSSTPIYIRIRKTTTGSTRYVNADTSGTITASGFTATFTLLTDTIASA